MTLIAIMFFRFFPGNDSCALIRQSVNPWQTDKRIRHWNFNLSAHSSRSGSMRIAPMNQNEKAPSPPSVSSGHCLKLTDRGEGWGEGDH